MTRTPRMEPGSTASRSSPSAPDRASCEPCWREMLSAVFDGPFSAEARLEALIDHIERGGARAAGSFGRAPGQPAAAARPGGGR